MIQRLILLACVLSLVNFFTYAQSTIVNYSYSNEDFVNPERGFYRYTETSSNGYTLLDSATCANYRLLHQPPSANYSIYCSLVFRNFILENFKNGPISSTFLQNVQADFNTARKAGVKLIARFVYTVVPNTGNCGNWICPPYGDAPKSIVLGHIQQLKPIFESNADVIACVQLGLIGTWGENYYTDYFGDASMPPYHLTSTNWTDRNQVLDSLLSAVPNEINVQVRYPQIKQKDVYGITAPTNVAPLTLTEAFSENKKSRIGFHNDCFLANFDDFGTYANYDNGNSDTTTLKPYKAADSKYVMVGGETCAPSTFSLCDNQGGLTIKDMNRMHYSYLNADYNNSVNNEWQTNNCMNDVKLKLGYRLYLTQGTYSNSITQGGNFSYNLQLQNIGFASPVNKRNVILVLINIVNDDEFHVVLSHNPRYWFNGSHNITGNVCVPDCIPPGNYKLYLKLSDPSPSLANKAAYSIRLANANTWLSSKGYNDLLHTVNIISGNTPCTAALTFQRSAPNIWNGPNNASWHGSNTYWSLQRIPDACDDVIITGNKTVNINAGNVGLARTLSLQSATNLNINDGGSIQILKQ